MAKSRPTRHPAQTLAAADRYIVLGHDLTTPEGEAAARDILYERLIERARWIDACETVARRFLGRPADDREDIPEEAFLSASHSLMWAGAEPPDWSDPEWFPPAVHAFIAEEDARLRTPGRRRRRRARPVPSARNSLRP